MADIRLSFSDGSRIGLIVRGKVSATHHPDLGQQHADAILANGAPIGFYGTGNGGSANRVYMAMDGVVYDNMALRVQRPYYGDLDSALSNRVISTVLLITVTPAQGLAFTNAWSSMAIHPGNFNILGGNCSTHASAAFIDCGLIGDGIPGLDTPDRLYDQLVASLPAASLQSISGFIGFVATSDGKGFDMVIRPYVDDPAVNRPNPGSYGALSLSGQRST